MSDRVWDGARFLRWEGYDYNTGLPSPCPEPGTTSYMGSEWRECRKGERADVVEVPFTVWGDYVGSTVERSNYRSLVEDYPDTFVEISGGYWSHVLYLPTFKLGVEGLREAIQGLLDYPLYNEEDHSMLEMDLAWEAWDGYLRSDIERELHDDMDMDHLGSDDWTEEQWTFFRDRYYSLTMETDYGPECEGATGSVVFPFHESVIAKLVHEIETMGFEHDPRRPNPNQLQLTEGE